MLLHQSTKIPPPFRRSYRVIFHDNTWQVKVHIVKFIFLTNEIILFKKKKKNPYTACLTKLRLFYIAAGEKTSMRANLTITNTTFDIQLEAWEEGTSLSIHILLKPRERQPFFWS